MVTLEMIFHIFNILKLVIIILTFNCFFAFEIRQPDNGVENLRYGDILLTKSQMERLEAFEDPSKKVRSHYRREAITMPWINAIVPYTLSHSFGLTEKMVIRRAMDKIEEVSCFKFQQRNLETDYLKISKLDGCYSYVGRVGGGQEMSLAKGCLHEYIIIHELLHAIGFEHEHQRYDRDNYIDVVYQNIEPSQYHNFDKVSIHEVTTFNYKYDLKSIMHYDETAFGRVNGMTRQKLITMIPKDKSIKLGDNLKLSTWDVEKLNIAGNCESKSIQKGGNNVIESGVEIPSMVVVDCLDLSPFCHIYLKQGLCINPIYIQLTTSLCSKTCFNCMPPV